MRLVPPFVFRIVVLLLLGWEVCGCSKKADDPSTASVGAGPSGGGAAPGPALGPSDPGPTIGPPPESAAVAEDDEAAPPATSGVGEDGYGYREQSPTGPIGPPPERRDEPMSDQELVDAAERVAEAASLMAEELRGEGVFAQQVLPILTSKCAECHGEREQEGGLSLHTAEAVEASGVVMAGSPDDSEMIARVVLPRGQRGAMPPRGPGLSEEEIETLRSWIESGASFGRGGAGIGPPTSATGSTGYGPASNPNGEEEEEAPPRDLSGLASRAFRSGSELDAMHYLYAASLTEGPGGERVLKQYKWVNGLKKPTLAVRWGIGVDYNKKGYWEGRPIPIGIHQELPGGDRGAGGSGSGSSNNSDDEKLSNFGNEAFEYFTGSFGDTLLWRLQGRIERGFFGDLLKQELEAAQGTDEDQEERFGANRFQSGGIGPAGSIGTTSGGSSANEDPEDGKAHIMPGVTMLGIASANELMKRAKEESVDLLVVAEVAAERNVKNGVISNTTKFRLLQVAEEKLLGATAGINNVKYQREKEKDPEKDLLNDELDKLFNKITDVQFKCADFPATVQPKQIAWAQKRVDGFSASSVGNPLSMLSEVKFLGYHKFLTANEVEGAFAKLLPQTKLAELKSDEAVKAAVASWLPQDRPRRSADEEDEPEEEGQPKRPAREFR